MISAVMISCDQRDSVRRETLDDLSTTDWAWPVRVVLDSEDLSPEEMNTFDPQQKQLHASRHALVIALRAQMPWIVFMEDDLLFNRHIAHNIKLWEPIRNGTLNFGSLYCPGDQDYGTLETGVCWREVNPEVCYGSQCYIMSREAAQWAVDNWYSIEGLQDIKLTRHARGKAVLYHVPCLVQHREVVSVWGGQHHFSNTFDAAWMCE